MLAAEYLTLPVPMQKAIVGFFRSGVSACGCARSGGAGAVATACAFSLARLGIERRRIVRVGTLLQVFRKNREPIK